jgi:hypothetical protein
VGNFTSSAASGESEAAPGGAPQLSGPLSLPYALPE